MDTPAPPTFGFPCDFIIHIEEVTPVHFTGDLDEDGYPVGEVEHGRKHFRAKVIGQTVGEDDKRQKAFESATYDPNSEERYHAYVDLLKIISHSLLRATMPTTENQYRHQP